MAFTLRNGEPARLRTASVADAEALVELDTALVQDGRGMVQTLDDVGDLDAKRRRVDDMYRGFSAGEATLILVAELAAGVVGCTELRQLRPTLCQHVGILSVGVHPDAQRQGVGRALMNALVAHAEECGLLRLELYVRADNDRALAMYRSLGFTLEATRARFIRRSDGGFVDDHVLVRFLHA